MIFFLKTVLIDQSLHFNVFLFNQFFQFSKLRINRIKFILMKLLKSFNLLNVLLILLFSLLFELLLEFQIPFMVSGAMHIDGV